MASDLTVQTIRGPGSGANANQILIPSGQKIVATEGGLVAPGQVVGFYQNLGVAQGSSINSSTIAELTAGLRVTLTPKSINNKIFLSFQIIARTGANGGRLGLYFYRSINGGSYTSIHGYPELSSNASTDQQDLITMFAVDTPSTTSPVTYTIYAQSSALITFDAGNFSSAQSNAGGRLLAMEVAQ